MTPPQPPAHKSLMSPVQRDATIRNLMLVIGSSMGTYFVHEGILSQDQVAFITNYGAAFLGIAALVVSWVWSVISRKQANMVAAVAQMPQVSKVEMVKTDGGPALAAAVSALPAVANNPAVNVTIAAT